MRGDPGRAIADMPTAYGCWLSLANSQIFVKRVLEDARKMSITREQPHSTPVLQVCNSSSSKIRVASDAMVLIVKN